MKAILYSMQGRKKGEVVLNPEIYAARVNHRLLELVINAFSAGLRRGTHDTKTRKEISGGGKKPWRQKGTGRARHGSIRSPIWRGGGTVFGPHPRSYVVNLPRTMRREALISALSLKGEEKNLMLVEDIKLESAKTKEWAEIMKALPLDGKRALCVVKEVTDDIKRASRNMEAWIKVRAASDVNAYHIMHRAKVVISEEALPVLESRLLGEEAVKADQAEDAKPEKIKKRKAAKPASKRKSVKKAAKKAEKK